jgi:hypothetical protein
MPDALRLYAGTQSGLVVLRGVGDIWTSMKGSREYQPFFADQVVDSVYGCRQQPEVVFAGVTHDGLYRTRNAGREWQRILEGDIRWVTVDPSDDRVIYAGTEPVRLYRSDDGGDSWEELTGLQGIAEDIKHNWWFPYPPHQGHVRHIYIDPEDSDLIYLALEHGGIVRSSDRGNSWEDVSKGIEYPAIHMIVRAPNTRDKYYTATSRGFYLADPPETGWKRAERGMSSDYFHDVVLLPGDAPAMFLAGGHGSPQYWDRPTGADGRIYRSEDGGASWRQVGTGLPVTHKGMCWQLAYNPYSQDSLLAAFGDVARGHTAGAPGEGAIYITYDRGDTWEEVGLQKRGSSFLKLPAIRVLWAAADD